MQFEGIPNFRDYGGYAAGGGRRLAKGVLFRSAQHANATPADLERLADLKLRTVVDFRGATERQAFPCRRHVGFDALVIYFDGETTGGWAPHEPAADASAFDVADAQALMVEVYRELPFRPGMTTALRLYLNAMATRDGASLVHCFAGKDRTGLAVTLLHRTLGVHADDATAEYLLTNTSGAVEQAFATSADSMRARYGQPVTDRAIRAFLGVHESYLDTALAAIVERYGSLHAYLTEAVGVEPSLPETLAERLLQ